MWQRCGRNEVRELRAPLNDLGEPRIIPATAQLCQQRRAGHEHEPIVAHSIKDRGGRPTPAETDTMTFVSRTASASLSSPCCRDRLIHNRHVQARVGDALANLSQAVL